MRLSWWSAPAGGDERDLTADHSQLAQAASGSNSADSGTNSAAGATTLSTGERLERIAASQGGSGWPRLGTGVDVSAGASHPNASMLRSAP